MSNQSERPSRECRKTEAGKSYELETITRNTKTASRKIEKIVQHLENDRDKEDTLGHLQTLDILVNEIGSLQLRAEQIEGSEEILKIIDAAELIAVTAKLSALKVKVEITTQKKVKSTVKHGEIETESPSIDVTDICATTPVLDASIDNLDPILNKDNVDPLSVDTGPIHNGEETATGASAATLDQRSSLSSSRKVIVDNLYCRLLRQIDHFKQVIASEEADLIRMESANIDCIFSNLKDANTRLIECLDEEGEIEQSIWMDKLDSDVFALKQEACSWLVADSQKSKSLNSKISSNKSSSEFSNPSATKSLQLKARAAGLKAEAEFLETVIKEGNPTSEKSLLGSNKTRTTGLKAEATFLQNERKERRQKSAKSSLESSRDSTTDFLQLKARTAGLKAEAAFLETVIKERSPKSEKSLLSSNSNKRSLISSQENMIDQQMNATIDDLKVKYNLLEKKILEQTKQAVKTRTKYEKSLRSGTSSKTSNITSLSAQQNNMSLLKLKKTMNDLKDKSDYLEGKIKKQMKSEVNKKEHEINKELADLNLQIGKIEAHTNTYKKTSKVHISTQQDNITSLQLKEILEYLNAKSKYLEKKINKQVKDEAAKGEQDIKRELADLDMKIERSLHKQDPPETQFHQSKECKAENRIQINNEGHILDIIRMVKAPKLTLIYLMETPLITLILDQTLER